LEWPNYVSLEEDTVRLYAISLTGKTKRGISHVRTVFHDTFSGNLKTGERNKFYFFAVHGGTDLDQQIPAFTIKDVYGSREEGFWMVGMELFKTGMDASISVRNINAEAILETYASSHGSEYVPFIQIDESRARNNDRYVSLDQ
jgi:hypothetical protein